MVPGLAEELDNFKLKMGLRLYQLADSSDTADLAREFLSPELSLLTFRAVLDEAETLRRRF